MHFQVSGRPDATDLVDWAVKKKCKKNPKFLTRIRACMVVCHES